MLTLEQIENKKELIDEMEEYFFLLEEDEENTDEEKEQFALARSEFEFFKKDEDASVELLYNTTTDFPTLNKVYFAMMLVSGFVFIND